MINQHINSSPPSAAYIRQENRPALVQLMACRPLGAKPLPEPVLTCCQLDHWEITSLKFQSTYKTFIHENTFQNVVSEMAAIWLKGH